jgi:ribonuclease Y
MQILIGAVALLVGLVLGFLVASGRAKREIAAARQVADGEAKAIADRARAEAESVAASIRSSAEREAEKLRERAERDGERKSAERRAELDKLDERLSKREEKLDARATELDRRINELAQEEKELQRQSQSIADRKRSVDERQVELETRLAEIAGLGREEAKNQIIEAVTDEARLAAAKAAREIEESAIDDAEKRAKKVLAVAIQRYAGEYVTERTVSVVNLPNDEMKGRIIGREGRNIRALEAATGVDFIVDDTPEAIIVSAFDPVRREIARLSLERLMSDGRIHPSRIEEIVAKTTKEIEKVCKEAGEKAAFELGLTGLHPEIIRTMGRLKYRTSYGQNIWSHSIEVGFLCGLMAGELGLNVKLARRAGFLHDLGKALPPSDEGGHAITGANFIKKYGEDELIVNAVAAHHDEVPQASVIAHLVIASDALSGARPGARREVLESYVKRLEDLERIPLSFDGVDKCFAVQAGREVRVVVANDRVTDDEAALLSRDIARRIEEELTYPGQIKVTVIREVRATEVAR